MSHRDSASSAGGPEDAPAVSGEHGWYFENGFVVYTAAYHIRRGFCCGSGCRHCPFEPPHVEGTTQVRS